MNSNSEKTKYIFGLVLKCMELQDQVQQLQRDPSASSSIKQLSMISKDIQNLYRQVLLPKSNCFAVPPISQMLVALRKQFNRLKLPLSEDQFQVLPGMIQSINSSGPKSIEGSLDIFRMQSQTEQNKQYESQLTLFKEEIERLHQRCYQYDNQVKELKQKFDKEIEASRMLKEENAKFQEQKNKEKLISELEVHQTNPIEPNNFKTIIQQKDQEIVQLRKDLALMDAQFFEKRYQLEASNKQLRDDLKKIKNHLQVLQNTKGSASLISKNLKAKQKIIQLIRKCQSDFIMQYRQLKQTKESKIRAAKEATIVQLLVLLETNTQLIFKEAS